MFAENRRNTYTVEHLQPALAKHVPNVKSGSSWELQNALGEVIFKTAVNAANTAHELLVAAETSILKMQNKLHEIAKSIYPDERFLKIDGAAPLTPEQDSTTAE